MSDTPSNCLLKFCECFNLQQSATYTTSILSFPIYQHNLYVTLCCIDFLQRKGVLQHLSTWPCVDEAVHWVSRVINY